MPVSSQEFRHGMRHLAAGVCLITTGEAPERGGLIATAVMSLTAEPAQLVVAINETASAFPLILRNRRFAVHVLGQEHRALADVFTGRTGVNGDDRFRDVVWETLATGSPVLPGALVTFDCVLKGQMPVATHSLLIGGVEAVSVAAEQSPLLYFDSAWAGLTPA